MAKRRGSKERSAAVLVLIALFKLLKALSLIALGFGMLHLLHRDIEATVTHWIEILRLDPGNEHIHAFISRIFRVTPGQLRALSAGTFLYACLFLTEGIGLLMRKRWAEYLTIVSTAVFIPIELWELTRHFTLVKVAVLIVNLAIVWYLAARVRRSA